MFYYFKRHELEHCTATRQSVNSLRGSFDRRHLLILLNGYGVIIVGHTLGILLILLTTATNPANVFFTLCRCDVLYFTPWWNLNGYTHFTCERVGGGKNVVFAPHTQK